MAKLPVWRGTPPAPLWIERGGIMVPAWAEDPCATGCCDVITPNCCDPPQTFPRHVTATVAGIANASGCTDCTGANGAYGIDLDDNGDGSLVVPVTVCGAPFDGLVVVSLCSNILSFNIVYPGSDNGVARTDFVGCDQGTWGTGAFTTQSIVCDFSVATISLG